MLYIGKKIQVSPGECRQLTLPHTAASMTSSLQGKTSLPACYGLIVLLIFSGQQLHDLSPHHMKLVP